MLDYRPGLRNISRRKTFPQKRNVSPTLPRRPPISRPTGSILTDSAKVQAMREYSGSSGTHYLWQRTACRALTLPTDDNRANHDWTPSFMQVKCGAQRNSTRSRLHIDASAAYGMASLDDGSTFMC